MCHRYEKWNARQKDLIDMKKNNASTRTFFDSVCGHGLCCFRCSNPQLSVGHGVCAVTALDCMQTLEQRHEEIFNKPQAWEENIYFLLSSAEITRLLVDDNAPRDDEPDDELESRDER